MGTKLVFNIIKDKIIIWFKSYLSRKGYKSICYEFWKKYFKKI